MLTELQNYIASYFGINNKDMDKITLLFKESKLKKGEYFTKSGNYCEKLSFVRSGFIRFFAETNGKEVTQWISTKGYFVTDQQIYTVLASNRDQNGIFKH